MRIAGAIAAVVIAAAAAWTCAALGMKSLIGIALPYAGLTALVAGTLTHAQVFADHGHGALLTHHIPFDLAAPNFHLTVTGPRRSMLAGSSLRPHFAVPFGDMMIAGCFGLLGALADHTPNWRDEILTALSSTQSAPPWESD